ncbi:hypothetical protein [Mycobacterium sp. 1245852.3]|uniref:hypothetical protein n=1 Tax=Mycobacterium sp. 1245852.3 TaxID=1856860 RepID=UPI0007FDFC25|nr:hypothetical protein [Mycobacterium sp. 1245852.3]OBJ80790.1 hypothetical protein A9W96_03090 [Mycobacterium sp. 1245852.3]
MHSTDAQPPRGGSHRDDVADILAQLDWHDLSCQADGGCTSRATHVVHRHAVDGCNRPGADPLGNIVGIVCTCCLRDLQIEVLRQVDQIRSSPHAYCLTCGVPVRQLSHALRVTQLRQ